MIECISSDIHDSYYIAQRYTTVNSFPLVADDKADRYSCVMKSIEEIRRENIRWLVRRGGNITQAELARRMEVSPAQVQQWKRGGGSVIGDAKVCSAHATNSSSGTCDLHRKHAFEPIEKFCAEYIALGY